MASKWALTSLPGVAGGFSTSTTSTLYSRQVRLRPPHPHPLSIPLLARFAHTIPRPRLAGTSSSSSSPSSSSPSSSSPSSSSPSPSTTTPAEQQQEEEKRGKDRTLAAPHYELTFTCLPCGARSRHRISKQGYHAGSVLVTCPVCRNRHVIADHLRIFGDRDLTVEDLLREKGRLVQRGTLGEDGDVEFWEDGTVSPRGERGGGSGVIEPGGGRGGSENRAEDRRAAGQTEEEGRQGEGEGEGAAPPGASFKERM